MPSLRLHSRVWRWPRAQAGGTAGGGPITVSMALAQQHREGRAEECMLSPWESDTPAAFQAKIQPSCMELPQRQRAGARAWA